VSTQILLQEKLSGAFKYRQNCLVAGARPGTRLGELTYLRIRLLTISFIKGEIRKLGLTRVYLYRRKFILNIVNKN